MIEISWKFPWKAVGSDAGTSGLQRELEKEVGPNHPLWGRTPKVIGRRIDNDDILVHLSDGSLACVHLVWHGKIDTHPEKYPSTVIYSSVSEFLPKMQQDAMEYPDAT